MTLRFDWIKDPYNLTKLNDKGAYDSRSEKEMAICNYLAFKGYSKDQIIAIFEKHLNNEGTHYFAKGENRFTYLDNTLSKVDWKKAKQAKNSNEAFFIKDNGEPDKRKLLEYVHTNESLYTGNVLQLYSTTRLWNDSLWTVADDNAKRQLVFNHFIKEYGLYLEPAEYKKLVEILNMIDINHLDHSSYFARYQEMIPIAFQNGTFYYWPKTGKHKFKPGVFNKDDVALYKLKIDYDEGYWTEDWRNGEVFHQTLTRFYDEHGIEALQYMLTSVLIPNYQPDKVLFIFGKPATGKTTIVNAFGALMSSGAMSTTDLSKVDKRFQLSLMENSICNLTIEKGEGQRIPVESLKYLSGGEQMIETEHKGKDKRNVKLLCKQIVITNEMPEMRYDEALKRRFMFALTRNPLSKSERDTNFRANFENEQKGNLIRFLFDGLRKLSDDNFQAPGGHGSIYEAFAKEADIYTGFVSDVFEPCDVRQYVTAAHVNEVFKRWFRLQNPDDTAKPDSQKKVSKEFKRACGNLSFEIDEDRPYVSFKEGKKQVRAYRGLRLKQKWFKSCMTQHVKDVEIYQDYYSQSSEDISFFITD